MFGGKLLDAKQTIANAEWDKTIQEERFATVTADFIWPLFTGGKINAANKAAEVEVHIGEDNFNQVQGELMSELVSRYYGLALASQVVEVRKKMFEAMDQHYSDAQKLFNEGMIAKVETAACNRSSKRSRKRMEKSPTKCTDHTVGPISNTCI